MQGWSCIWGLRMELTVNLNLFSRGTHHVLHLSGSMVEAHLSSRPQCLCLGGLGRAEEWPDPCGDAGSPTPGPPGSGSSSPAPPVLSVTNREPHAHTTEVEMTQVHRLTVNRSSNICTSCRFCVLGVTNSHQKTLPWRSSSGRTLSISNFL